MEYKVSIAPAMANALKIRDKLGLRRLQFHGAIAGGILCAFIIALLSHIIMAYDISGNHMALWLYNDMPATVFDTIKSMSMTNPVDTVGGKWWLLTGGVLMASLLYFRRHIFWLPHPIGLIMFVNPGMNAYWFPIFIGWVCKVLANRYGNKETYRRLRYVFIGLIVGELLICFLSGRPLDTA